MPEKNLHRVPITIAVISDLHVGVGARAKDLCPTPDSTALESNYKARFIEFLNTNSIGADYLMVPGDISNGAQPDEFLLASAVISEIAAALKVPDDQLMMVPGNHDVDWEVLKIPDRTGVRHAQRYDGLKNRACIFHGVMCIGSPNLLEPPHFCAWEFDDMIVIGYNSAWHDDPAIAVHHGLIADDHLKELSEYLTGADLSPARLKVLLVHHHPVQYSDPIAEIPDFSVMTNAQKLLSELRRHGFDLLVHGHKHNPNFGTYAVDSRSPLAVLGAGSFSAALDTRWSGTVTNQFHRIRIEGRDEKSGCVYGLVESWAYTCARGWTPSDRNNGILHELPFGSYMQPSELENEITPVVKFLLRNKSFTTWSTVLSKLPRLRYLPPDLVVEILDRISIALGLKRHGLPDDEIILLKKEGGDGKRRSKRSRRPVRGR